MKLKWKLGIAVPIALLPDALLLAGIASWFAVPNFRFWVRNAHLAVRPVPSACKQRAAVFQTRVERIKAEARASLRPGTKKADVIRFFASENIPVDFHQVAGHSEASGQLYVTGLAECASVACGDDSAMIGVRVDVNENGTVVSDPEVVGMYTNCL